VKNCKVSYLILLLTPFVLGFAFGLDIYIPIVPQMSAIFSTSPALIQLTLSLFILITGLGQLFIGPLSDQFGRKKILYAASTCYILGCIGCVFSTHIVGLIVARIISSIGACGMLVTSFAIVRDLYSNDKSAKVYSFLNGAIGISPTFAPIIGGYLAVYLGWQSIFLFLAFIGILSLLMTKYFIEETHKKDNRVKIDSAIFERYSKVFKNRQFLTFALISGSAESVFFCFFSTSPFIIIDFLGVSTERFGFYFAVFGLVIALGGVLSGKLIEKFGVLHTLRSGMILMLLGGLTMLTWHFVTGLTLSGFLIPMSIACTGAIFLVGGSASAALNPFGAISGTASAAFGSVEFSLSSLIGSLLMLFPVTSTIPYSIAIIIMSIFSLVLFARRGVVETECIESLEPNHIS
jgi:MFS transporter, DHA1 family, chloramphenicol/florfenicol resistance protein